MFNLQFSKRDNLHTMHTVNEWFVDGNVVYTKITEAGMWMTIKGVAKRPGVFTSDKMTFDCFVPKKELINKQYTKLFAKGKFYFKQDKTYFIVSKIMKEVK